MNSHRIWIKTIYYSIPIESTSLHDFLWGYFGEGCACIEPLFIIRKLARLWMDETSQTTHFELGNLLDRICDELATCTRDSSTCDRYQAVCYCVVYIAVMNVEQSVFFPFPTLPLYVNMTLKWKNQKNRHIHTFAALPHRDTSHSAIQSHRHLIYDSISVDKPHTSCTACHFSRLQSIADCVWIQTEKSARDIMRKSSHRHITIIIIINWKLVFRFQFERSSNDARTTSWKRKS